MDPKTGKTLKSFDTLGAGLYGKLTTPSGAHGLKWVDGKYWMAVPASGKIFLMEPESGAIVRSIPAPTVRTHGLAWDNRTLWCVCSTEREIYKMDPRDGKLLAKIKLAKDDPEPHGLDLYQGIMWYSDASSGWSRSSYEDADRHNKRPCPLRLCAQRRLDTYVGNPFNGTQVLLEVRNTLAK